MRLRTLSRILVALVAVALILPAPALALDNPNLTPTPGGVVNPAPPVVDRGLVPAGVTVGGADIGGLTEDRARSVILASVKASALPAITVKAADKTYTLASADYFFTDVESMLYDAFSATGPVALTPRYGFNAAGIGPLVDSIAKADTAGSNARWAVSGNRLKLIPSRPTRRTDRATGRSRILAALKAEAASGAAQPAVIVPVTTGTPRVTEKNLGRAILVVLAERKLRLYDPAKGGYILKLYGCAIGQPAYPTPTGTFEIIEKRYLPTWWNPAPNGWGSSMPPYIGPGPSNPLGTRALNLNADGIRIHGTQNVGSIGTAASHGCIRLVRQNIEELYPMVSVGTPVYILAR